MEELKSMNDDVPMSILSRLPAVDLIEYKSVCKWWHRLISDRSFIRLQLKKTEPISGFFFQGRYQFSSDDIRHVSYVPLVKPNGCDKVVNGLVLDFLPEEVTVMSTSHGLVCCRSCMPIHGPLIFICNPSNKNWISFNWKNPNTDDSLVLVFDPFKDPVDISTKFKVVKAHQIVIFTEMEEDEDEDEEENSFVTFEIFNSETREWKALKEVCYCNDRLLKNKGIYIGGILHWLTSGDQVLTLDLENEFSLLFPGPFPRTEFESIPEMCIGESEDGRLSYIIVSEFGIHVWVLEDYYEANKWGVEFSITYDALEEEYPQFFYKAKERLIRWKMVITENNHPWIDPFAFKNGILFMRMEGKVYSYHFKNMKMERLCATQELGMNTTYFPTFLPYTMSLVPLASDSEI